MAEITSLENRSVISISGPDRKKFLQGLITGDVIKAKNNEAIYSLMLSPQGRFLYDFFIFEHNEELLLDSNAARQDEIIKKLSLYKLRAQIEIKKRDDLAVFFAKNLSKEINIIAASLDPRDHYLGFRIIAAKNSAPQNTNLDFYNFLRINLKIPDDSDLIFDKSLPLEYGFDNLNAIDYQKGCYVGQEVTARTHYKGVIRKKIFLVEIENCVAVNKESEITCDDKNVGLVLSSVFYENKLLALALIKNIDVAGDMIDFSEKNLEVNGNRIKIIK